MKRGRKRRLRGKSKNVLLITITVFAMCMFVGAVEIVMEETLKGLIIIILSLLWLGAFAWANA